jgi:cell division septal protein FtsQ
MAGARGSARRELVARVFGSRNRRRRARIPLPSPRAAVVIALAVALPPTVGAFAWPYVRDAIRQHPYFALTDVIVRAPHRIPPDEIRRTAGITPGMSVWDVDPPAAESRLRAHPWVRSARVRRELPHRAIIQVREERPVAIVVIEHANGAEYYVSARGRIFAPVARGDARDLPYVTGLAPADLAEGDGFAPRALRRAIGLMRRSGNLEVSEIHLDRTRGLTLMPVRPAIPIELGWHRFEEKLGRFPRVMALWAGREDEIAAVSLFFDDEVIVRTRGAARRRT